MKFSENELNDNGVFIGDIYVLNYYEILVFFEVCKTKANSVFLVELGTKRYKNGVMFLKGYKASKKPLVITENNTRTKATYEVRPRKDLSLPILITTDTVLYKHAKENVRHPSVGVFYATKIVDYMNRYWITDEEKYEINGIA